MRAIREHAQRIERTPRPAMSRLLKSICVICLVVLPVTWLKQDRLPAALALSSALAAEPRQVEIAHPPIDVDEGGTAYHVEPSHRYALDGLVVSYRLHDGDHLLHRLWNDHLNVADLCVVWGSDAAGVDLHAFEFANGEFTCTFRTRSDEAWRSFRLDQISNNHLLTADPAIRRRIGDVAVGDQVHLEGYLASYSNDSGFHRGTSTTRKDTGNGACETVYVTAFEILDPAPRGWRRLQSAATWGLLLSASLWLVGVARAWF
jgi:hypothetical protein